MICKTRDLNLGKAFALAAMAMLLFLAACSNFSRPPVMAEDFQVTLFDGGDFRLSDQLGKKSVVLNFWFPSCPPCVAEMPDFELLHQKFKGDGLKVIGVEFLGLDSVEDGQTFVERLNVDYMLGPDQTADDSGQIVMDYKITGFPTTLFIDRDQNIVRKWTGALNLEKLEELTLAIMN
mgnify:CR=1 FL=1